MRNLLALIGLVVVVFVAVGWYCGWYTVSVQRNGDGKLNIQTEVNTSKVSQDTSGFFQRIGQVLSEKMEKSGPPAVAPGNTPGPVPSPPPLAQPAFNGGWLFTPSRPGTAKGS